MYWYEEEVKQLENRQRGNKADPGIIFYGSSSIRMWESLNADFPNRKVTNFGFGGSTLAACVWFFDRIFTDSNPKAFVFYAGDNDLGDGRHPEEVFIFFQQLMAATTSKFGNIPCFFVSLKPSLSRWHQADQFRYTNNLIESEIIKRQNNWSFIDVFSKMLNKSGNPEPSLFQGDGLHLTPSGYQLWTEIITQKLNNSLPIY